LPLGLCLYEESWHQGIIGILASRIKEMTNRPVFAFAHHNEQELKGSGRSIAGVHLKDVLERIAANQPDLIIKFGGHAMAAGMSIAKENLERFSECFNRALQEILSEEDLEGVIHTDGELPVTAMTIDTALLLRNEGPWGQGFPEPLFDGQFKVLTHKILKGKHIKFSLIHPEQLFQIEAIAFNQDQSKMMLNPDQLLHIAYRLDINEYQGNRKLQLLIDYFDVL
jgi:single-stranded-DNA-specific exonuclease